ncbi:hypothetical protein RCH09_002671 [Actimicrobium sp. GrIS 1.19]|uniref:putative porin n=1 Tax=Actimicrobium sp. GrIS 1.19 TaxID=3071708 RepID=UPI002DFAA188|nr:hypothetical protein [Actimicrobium sp. GrIS 1.19]
MTTSRSRHSKHAAAVLLATTLIAASFPAHSDERTDLETLRATTVSLIEALVDSGVLSRAKADKLFKDAAVSAQAKLAATQAAEVQPPELGKDGKKIVRVPYISEAVKLEMRNQIKQEVLAQSKTERWGEPGALPEWMRRFKFEGDVRVRYEQTKLNRNNTLAGADYTDDLYTRAADIVGNALIGGTSSFDTQEDKSRSRLRARLGVTAQISDTVTAGMTFSTGNTTDRTSTNQTLGQNFNKYSVVLDRGYIKLDPKPWVSFSAGRIANPYFGTDLLWADDLNFEGFALTVKPKVSDDFHPFATAGYFPLREGNPGSSTSRSLVGLQTGFDWKLAPQTKLKVAASLYQFHNIEGQSETNETHATATDYVTRYEYAAGFRQRGNTLFYVNAPDDPNVNWGLASKFRELNLTASLDLAQLNPVHVILTGDYVKNTGFDRSDIEKRTGFRIEDGRNYGYLGKVQVGHPTMAERGDWNVSLAYRYLGSDAVLDAFTNSDFGLGGTNNKGILFGLNYGIDKNTWLSARWLQSDLIDPMVPRRIGSTPVTKLSVDVFQVDLNARF